MKAFRKVDVKRPPRITFAIGLCISLPGKSPRNAKGIKASAVKSTENNSKSCEKPLNVRHDTVFLHIYLTEVRMLAPHALKGQKLLAQGSALGIIAIGKAPCKGKSFMYCLDF